MLTKNATHNTAIMIRKEVASLLPTWAKGKLEIINIGQDKQAQVMFSIIMSDLNIHWVPKFLCFLYC